MNNTTLELIRIIKEDINTLCNNILEKESRLNRVISEINKEKDLLTIRFSYFVELLNKYCFNFERFPFKEKNFEFLGNRLDLFNEIFITKDNFNLDDQIIFYYFRRPETFNNPIIVFYLLYYTIFIKYLLSSKDISIIFKELYDQWRNSFKEKKIPLTFITTIPAFSIKDEFNITEEIQIKDITSHFRIKKISKEKLESSYYLWKFIDDDFDFDFDDNLDLVGTCLFYNTTLSFIYYDKRKKDDILKLKDEFNEKVLNLIQVINTFYLLDFNFKYSKYIIELPWWFIPSINKFRNIKGGFFWFNFLEKEKKEEFLELYKNVLRSKIFVSNNYTIIMNRYHQIFNRDSYPDIILDTFIILEWLFTRGMGAELTYRLSLNIALFISSNWMEFKKINGFMKDLYDLRSSIVHGGKWEKIGNKIIKKYNLKDSKDVIKELKSILNKCIIRLINLIINESNVLKKFEDKHYFFETSKIFKDVL
jgi:hypothetical protein